MLHNLDSFGALKPICLARSKLSNCVVKLKLLPTKPYNKQSNGRFATSALSCSFKLPDAVFRGFLYGSSPLAIRSSFILLNPSNGSTISPLISNCSGNGGFNCNGTEFMVFTFAVTSSPCTPSPRVTACTNAPFL